MKRNCFSLMGTSTQSIFATADALLIPPSIKAICFPPHRRREPYSSQKYSAASWSWDGSLVFMPRADPDPLLNLLDCLVDYMDRVGSMPAFVMRSLAQL
jgi:hypothetical protein